MNVVAVVVTVVAAAVVVAVRMRKRRRSDFASGPAGRFAPQLRNGVQSGNRMLPAG